MRASAEKKSTICIDKIKFIEEYKKVKENKGIDDASILSRAKACLGEFQVKKEIMIDTFDSTKVRLNPIAVIAFCKAFDIPVDDTDRALSFKWKNRFLKLYTEVQNSGCMPSQVVRDLNEYCDISKSTIEDTLSRKKLNINTLVVLAFCKKYGYDIDEIYSPGYSGKKECAALAVQTYSNAVEKELPSGFTGTFYGYFFNSTPDYTQQGILDQFTLNISSHEITMILRHFSPNTVTSYAPRYMRGQIIYNEDGKTPSGMLAIAFNSDDGKNFCILAYNKIQLINPLYFRKGAMLIRGCSVERIPVIQSFIITHKEIDLNIEENRRSIQGELTLTNNAILIERDRLRDYMYSELLQKYFGKVSYQNALREYIELDENIIRALNVCNKDELYKTLLQMKSDSVNPRLFTFPSLSTDRAWRYIISLCEEETLWREEEPFQEE